MKRTVLAPLTLLAATLTWLAAPASASADTYENVTIDAVLDGRLYLPETPGDAPPAMILMHGCGGMWSDDDPSAGAVHEIERWGMELAAQGYVVIAVDSYGGRTPVGVDWVAYQYQCSGSTYGGAVDPYTTRVDDIAAAYDYLVEEHGASSVGIMGWSQGAQAVMVASAATPRGSNVAYASPPVYSAAVAYYPGCGSALGYGLSSTKDGYWRPAMPMRLQVGALDSFHANCERRADNAIASYSADLTWVDYAGVGHSFDNAGGDAFPAAKCTASELADPGMTTICAERDADVDSLAFVLAEVTGV